MTATRKLQAVCRKTTKCWWAEAINSERRELMIDLKGISKTYKRPSGEPVAALMDISLQIGRGELVSIVGASGSGKSTMMNILGLLDSASQGQYLLNGQDVTTLDVNRQAEIRNKK